MHPSGVGMEPVDMLSARIVIGRKIKRHPHKARSGLFTLGVRGSAEMRKRTTLPAGGGLRRTALRFHAPDLPCC